MPRHRQTRDFDELNSEVTSTPQQVNQQDRASRKIKHPKSSIRFTNHVLAKLASFMTSRGPTDRGKIKVVTSSLIPASGDEGPTTVPLTCRACHQKKHYRLKESIKTSLLTDEKLPMRQNGSIWKQEALRNELSEIGIYCPDCVIVMPGMMQSSSPTTTETTVEKPHLRFKDGYPKSVPPMKTKGQVLAGLMPLLEKLLSTPIVDQLRPLTEDDTLFDFDPLHDLPLEDKDVLHSFSTTLKAHTDDYMRQNDDLSRDPDVNREIVKNRNLVYMEKSHVQDRCKIRPRSRYYESTRGAERVNKVRPCEIIARFSTHFFVLSYYTFGGQNLEQAVEFDRRKLYLQTQHIDAGDDSAISNAVVKVHGKDTKDGFICAVPEMRYYHEPMSAGEGGIVPESRKYVADYVVGMMSCLRQHGEQLLQGSGEQQDMATCASSAGFQHALRAWSDSEESDEGMADELAERADEVNQNDDPPSFDTENISSGEDSVNSTASKSSTSVQLTYQADGQHSQIDTAISTPDPSTLPESQDESSKSFAALPPPVPPQQGQRWDPDREAESCDVLDAGPSEGKKSGTSANEASWRRLSTLATHADNGRPYNNPVSALASAVNRRGGLGSRLGTNRARR